MTFLNPLLLLGALGIGLPILAHLLNRHQVQQTDWAAMQFLNRAVRVRSRQIRLKDILLLCLRCLVVLLMVAALARPFQDRNAGGLASVGEPSTGVIIALDASFSMQHGKKGATRFDQALERVRVICDSIPVGNPVTLVLLGDEHRVVARNVAYDPETFDALLQEQKPTPESLDLDSLPRRLKGLLNAITMPQKEVHIVTDLQARDWTERSAWFGAALADLSRRASILIVPVGGDNSENLALTGLDLTSGVLRKDTYARYRATVRNCGTMLAQQVRVSAFIGTSSVDTKIIPAIAPGTAESVSLTLPLRDTGPIRITARLEPDALDADNARHAVVVVRDRVSVLCAAGSSSTADSATGLITAALRARDTSDARDDLSVHAVPWVDLPMQDLSRFDVVILANVPDIAPEQARSLERYVRAGNGLIWFAGDRVKADVWNKRSALGDAPLLPAMIGQPIKTSDALGIGRPLDPSLTEHPVARPLLSLPEDLLGETRFRHLVQVVPAATSTQVLTLAGSDSPVLLEQSLGRGTVFMFTTSADPTWNNMATTPAFPMLLQQMVTYLTAREFETPRLVGDPLSLSYEDQPDTTEAVFETPSGQTIPVPVREYRNQYGAMLARAGEPGFYQTRVSLQAESAPIAVNVDTRESTVTPLAPQALMRRLEGTGVRVTPTEEELLVAIDETRTSRSLWRVLLLAGVLFFLAEGVLAEWMLGRGTTSRRGEDA